MAVMIDVLESLCLDTLIPEVIQNASENTFRVVRNRCSFTGQCMTHLWVHKMVMN